MVVTPNLHEAGALVGLPVHTLDEMREAARAIHAMGPRYVVVKGGHLADSDQAVDVLFDGVVFLKFPAPRAQTRHTHGTGCIFSAAIAAGLARGAASPRCRGARQGTDHRTDRGGDADREGARPGGSGRGAERLCAAIPGGPFGSALAGAARRRSIFHLRTSCAPAIVVSMLQTEG
jgi:sugar/nucleoside kinase (ribokinase family)